MLHTMTGLRVPFEWMPLAMANGIEWADDRRGKRDRFDCLYRRNWSVNGLLWYMGAISTLLYTPRWLATSRKQQAFRQSLETTR